VILQVILSESAPSLGEGAKESKGPCRDSIADFSAGSVQDSN